MQPRLRPRRAAPDHPELPLPVLRIIHRIIARFLIQQAADNAVGHRQLGDA